MKLNDLPSQYVPFEKIDIGTNHLVNVKVLFTVNEHIPLLIGSGDIPRIWLSIPADATGENWQLLIRDNRSFHPEVTVQIENNIVSVNTPDGEVLKVRKESENWINILSINLRPFGINIHGDERLLSVMDNELTGNSFVNVEVMVGIGREPNGA